MLSPCCEYICSPAYKEGCDEYLNATILFQLLKEEIKSCEGPCSEITRRERDAKIRAYEHVQAMMTGIWNSGERLYIKDKYPKKGDRNEKPHQ